MAVSPPQEVILFGLFELDTAVGQLSRQGIRLRLPQQPLQLLTILLEHPGEICTREELRQRLWPSDVFVDFDHGLNKSIQKLRDTLGDSAASPRYIETIPRVGYRFIAPVSGGVKTSRPVASAVPSPDAAEPPPSVAKPVASQAMPHRWWLAAMIAIMVGGGFALYLFLRTRPPMVRYTKLTDFTDSASNPALSPDGKVLAFFRGGDPFTSSDAIFTKMLPYGEPRLLTADDRQKYGLAFSPDGQQIAYTVMQGQTFATVAISALGGDSHLLLNNAAGLTWLDTRNILFSRFRSGLHLGVVSSTIAGDHLRELYYPPQERATAHYSFASPDRASALVVEMDGNGDWDQCRLISLQSTSAARPVGPDGACTAAGWSPDGSWMYFVAIVDGQSHLWRQPFRDGQPQQLTFGPTEEEGLAVESSGNSVITGMGVHESALWLHDQQGERSVSNEGEILTDLTPPLFTAGDKFLYYLTRHQPDASGPELWRLSLATHKTEAVFPGIKVASFDISADGATVIYTTPPHEQISELCIASIDRTSPPRQILNGHLRSAHFGPPGQAIFQEAENNTLYIGRVNLNGSGRSRVIPFPIHELQSVSPGRKWVSAVVLYPHGKAVLPIIMAIPLNGGEPLRLCESYCTVTWASSGKYLYIPVEAATRAGPGRSIAVPLGPEESLPKFPAEGIRSGDTADVVSGGKSVNRTDIIGGTDLSEYAWVNTTVHRNLYRVTIP